MGVTIPLQQRIGAFVVCWGLYEAHLEEVIWLLNNEDVKGNRPTTDSSPVSAWFRVLCRGSEHLSMEANAVLDTAAAASESLLAYRNSLIHGTLLSFPGANSITFLRNPAWRGEVRNRPAGDAHVDENLLDMAIESAWALFRLVACFKQGQTIEQLSPQIEAMAKELRRAKSFARELQHLTALMNHEKY